MLESSDTDAIFLELYTSQGCYSCPPAEAWLNRFTQDPRLWKELIPINLHVDYWDYLGWKDPFARPEFSKRQRHYKKHGHTHNVATPGFVINGQGWNGWFRAQSLPDKTNKAEGKLIAALNHPFVQTRYRTDNTTIKTPYVHVAILGFGIQTKVPKGENAGKTLEHDFVVVGYHKEMMKLEEAHWQAEVYLPHTVNVKMSRQAIAIWITEKDDPYPIQALGDWL